MSSTEVSLSQRWRLLGLNALVFLICYQGASHYAASVRTYSWAMPLDARIPFVPWMLLPYMTLGVVFLSIFVCNKNEQLLRTLSHTTLFATVCAGVCFVWFPAKFSVQAPITDLALLSQLQVAMLSLDRPFNQLPSLHVAYAVILISVLSKGIKNRWRRMALGFWLGLSAVSTLFVYQHHVLDCVGGLALGFLSIYIIRACMSSTVDPPVAFYYFVASICCFILGLLFLPRGLTLYLCASLCLVSLAYFRQDRNFLHKKNGCHPWWIRFIYAPYLMGYWVTWRLMRSWQRPHRKDLFVRHTAQLWAGRCLTAKEFSSLPSDCTVIDLSPELREGLARQSSHYIHIPILDIVTIPRSALDECMEIIHSAITAQNVVYVHCAMGFSRSQTIAKHYLENYLNQHPDEDDDLHLPN